MTAKTFHMGSRGIEKMPGWHSWRHQTAGAQDAAREEYTSLHGRKARQRRAKDRAEAFASLTPGERYQQISRNRSEYDARRAVAS